MRTLSVVNSRIQPSTASRAPEKWVAGLAVLLALGVTGAGVGAAERLATEKGQGIDRLTIQSPVPGPLPLLRDADGHFTLLLSTGTKAPAAWPRGLKDLVREPADGGEIRTVTFDVAPGVHLVYRTIPGGTAIDIVHGSPEVVTAAGGERDTRPLPARAVSVGLVFTAARAALFRLGGAVILVLPRASDLELAGLPPRPIASAEEEVQGEYRIFRLTLTRETNVALVQEGKGLWRLGFGGAEAPKRLPFVFEQDGRGVRFTEMGDAPQPVSLRFPEFGTIAVVLADAAAGVGEGRSPYLQVLPADVGAVVVPRTESLIARGDGATAVITASEQAVRR